MWRVPLSRPVSPPAWGGAWLPGLLAAALLTATLSAGSAGAAGADPATTPPGPAGGVASTPVRTVETASGPVGYRIVGSGPPLVLVTGFSASMDDWSPAFVDALAAHHRVVVFDNAGVGATGMVDPLTVTTMADQTSALMAALGLGRTAVLGWSMGGMIAQALAVLHPAQVSRLVLAATQAGTGDALAVPPAAAAEAASTDPATVLGVLFPTGQGAAVQRYVRGILEYPDYYSAPASTKAAQTAAIAQWLAGGDPAGHRMEDIAVPTLVAHGTVDALDPVANDRLLAKDIRGAVLALYPGAGHGFLFQDTASVVSRIDDFLR